MSKGANVALAALSEDTSAVVVGLSWSSPAGEGDADVSVLLLGPDGKVRHDGDFYFYNHPASPDGSVQLLGKTPAGNGSEDRVSLDLGAVPPGVERIVIAASQYGDGRFGDLDELRLTLADRSGEMLLGYAIEGATDERAFLFGELYLREGAWKFRAIGQGYASGLAGLATDFGIDVDDEGEGEEGAAPPQDAQASATAAPGSPEPSTDPAPAPAPPVALPAQRPAPEPSAAKPVRRRPRTAKKKVTLPAARQRTLAENDAWRSARLFPAASLKSDRERETRSTSVLLAAMAQVPEFGRRLTAAFGAPAGRMETFTEVTLPHGETPRRPDGIIRVERAGKLWTALVETKTNGNPLRADQVQSYVDIAARRGYEAVITLSNDVALEGRPLVEVKMDRRRKHKVALWHLSWAEVAHQAQLLIRHEGVGNAAHAWLLQELLHYLQHDNSGCQGFQNMGPSWVQVRNGIDAETLCPGDARAVDVIESWERLVRQVCLRIGGELGRKAMPVQRGKRGSDPAARRAALADRLCEDGRLTAELRVDGSPGVLALTADLRTGKLRTSVEVPVPEGGYPLSSAKRLLRMLAEAPADLHVETLVEEGNGPRSTLERLRPEPADLLPRNGERIMGFRLSLFKGVGTTRGSAASGFIRSVDEAVDHFHAQVVAHLPVPDSRPARRPVPA
ncbi:TerD family protein [Streptomyces albidoflavus]